MFSSHSWYFVAPKPSEHRQFSNLRFWLSLTLPHPKHPDRSDHPATGGVAALGSASALTISRACPTLPSRVSTAGLRAPGEQSTCRGGAPEVVRPLQERSSSQSLAGAERSFFLAVGEPAVRTWSQLDQLEVWKSLVAKTSATSPSQLPVGTRIAGL